MSEKKATDAVVFPVADALFARGIHPGPTLVLKHIPGGSYTTVIAALARWEAKRKEEALKEPAPAEVTSRAGEFARSIWHLAAEHAAQATERLRRETEGKIQNLEVELRGAQDHICQLEKQFALQKRHLNDARIDLDRQQSLIQSQTDQIGRMMRELAESSRAATAARSDQQSQAIHAASLTAENDAHKKQIAELLKQLHGQPSTSDNP